jgi:hypothetical protein
MVQWVDVRERAKLSKKVSMKRPIVLSKHKAHVCLCSLSWWGSDGMDRMQLTVSRPREIVPTNFAMRTTGARIFTTCKILGPRGIVVSD